MPRKPLFRCVSLIGIGLIGSSMARAMRRDPSIAGRIVAAARTDKTCATVLRLGIADAATTDVVAAVKDADMVFICTPVGACAEVARAIGPALAPGTIVSDVGSVKQSVIRDIARHLPEGVAFVPGHPIAGTEHSGPEAGFAELFQGRWTILTPLPGSDRGPVDKVAEFWRRCGSQVEVMDPAHHDMILAITSHLPHLISYTIVGTATDLGDDLKAEVFKFAAGGFRDFTRIAASDPVMWRDVFLNNRQAVLEMLQRFLEDLSQLQRWIRRGEGDKLEALFTRTRAIRRGVIEAKQA
ncbi:MAG: prephenate/arogenate dehydrogenase family protein [Proteobacteria bacterium]|nr:prephenate/arogenate dehydrogenase family protein [Pseudomonadota bacterium]